jgi:hypothetical protein
VDAHMCRGWWASWGASVARACVCVFVCVRVATSRRGHVEVQASPTVSPGNGGPLSSEAAVGYAAVGLLITDEAVA